jgi:hypothetical protein
MFIVFFKMEQNNWEWKICVENSQHYKTSINNLHTKIHILNTHLFNI